MISPVFLFSKLFPVYFSFAFVSSSFSCRGAGFALVVFLWIKAGWLSCHHKLQMKEKLQPPLQLFLANVADGYVCFPKLTLLNVWAKSKEAFGFLWIRHNLFWERMRLPAAFWRKEERFSGQASRLELSGYWHSWRIFFPLAVLGQGQFTAYWEGLWFLIKLNTFYFFFLSLAASMKSKI